MPTDPTTATPDELACAWCEVEAVVYQPLVCRPPRLASYHYCTHPARAGETAVVQAGGLPGPSCCCTLNGGCPSYQLSPALAASAAARRTPA